MLPRLINKNILTSPCILRNGITLVSAYFIIFIHSISLQVLLDLNAADNNEIPTKSLLKKEIKKIVNSTCQEKISVQDSASEITVSKQFQRVLYADILILDFYYFLTLKRFTKFQAYYHTRLLSFDIFLPLPWICSVEINMKSHCG